MTYDEQFPNGQRYRRWQSVTHELAVRDSALLHYLTARFPHAKPLQDAYNATPRDRVVEPVPFYDSFIGTAFDHMIQMRFDSTTRIRTVEFGALVATGDGFLCFDALDAISRFDWQTCTD
jgi:hypothetical protein